jgi:hypothetical protein
VVVAFIIVGLFFGRVQEDSLRASCYLGTGPQPAFCGESSNVPSHHVPHATVGALLGFACVGLGRAGSKHRVASTP